MIAARIQKCESGNRFCVKGKMYLKCGGPSGIDKVRIERREGRRIMQDDNGLSTIQSNNTLPKKNLI